MTGNKQRVMELIRTVSPVLFLNTFFWIMVRTDQVYRDENGEGRIYLQVEYRAKCNKTKELKSWKGRKWYLSEYMTDDEIIKTAWCAFEATIKHEAMESFKVNGQPLFNPHTPYDVLLTVSNKEIKRDG